MADANAINVVLLSYLWIFNGSRGGRVESLPLRSMTILQYHSRLVYSCMRYTIIAHWKHLDNAHSIMAALIINISFGLLAYYLKTVNKSGLIGGLVVGTTIYFCLGIGGFLILFTFFALGSWSSSTNTRRHARRCPGKQRKAQFKTRICEGGTFCCSF